MKINYLEQLNNTIKILKDTKHSMHRKLVYNLKKEYGYKDCAEILAQYENRRDSLVDLLENFCQYDFEMLFCFQNLEKSTKRQLYKRLMQNFSSDFAIYDYALSNKFKKNNFPFYF